MKLEFDEARVETTELSPFISIADGRVQIFSDNKQVLLDGRDTCFQAKQAEILAILALRPDEIVSPLEICESIWGGYDKNKSDTLKTHVNKLRNKLPDDLSDVNTGLLRSHRTRGYEVKSTLLTSQDGSKGEARFIGDNRIEVNMPAALVVADGEILKSFSPRLFRLLAHITEEPGRLYSYEEIAQKEWGNFNQKIEHSVFMGIKQVRYALGRKDLGNSETGAVRNVQSLGYVAITHL